MHDLVVVLPGITGSTLRKGGKDVWALSGGALWSYGARALSPSRRKRHTKILDGSWMALRPMSGVR